MLDWSVACQLLQGGVVLLIRPHGTFFFAVIIVLCYPDGVPGADCPQTRRKRVDGAVVDGNVPLHALGQPDISVQHISVRPVGIDQPLRHAPQSLDVPVIEYAGVQALIAFPDLLVQGVVVLHGKMQMQGVLFRFFADPFFVEPMLGAVWIAVEPQPGSADGASGCCLFHK